MGLMGFSAGGQTVAQTIFGQQSVAGSGPVGNRSNLDFGILVYPAYMLDPDDDTKLNSSLTVTENSPPLFFAHAADDPYSCTGSTLLHGELVRKGVMSEVHVFAGGGHGFGGRANNQPSDVWMDLCESWMKSSGFAN